MIAARALLLAGAGRRGIREREPNAFSLPQIPNQFIQGVLVLNERILTIGRNASRSTSLQADTPNFFSTHASSHHSIGGTGSRRLTTCEFCRIETIQGARTSWHMSLSFETMTACNPFAAALMASVPITSSASKPETVIIGMLYASHSRLM